jgi:hypothetical protein
LDGDGRLAQRDVHAENPQCGSVPHTESAEGMS